MLCSAVFDGAGVVQHGMLVTASVLQNGDIRNSSGRNFTSLVAWCKSVLGVSVMRLDAVCRQVGPSPVLTILRAHQIAVGHEIADVLEM